MSDVVEGNATDVTEEPKAVAVRKPDRTPLSQRDPVALAQHFASSGYFKDADDMSKAVVKIVAGEELGYGPMTAMSGIHIIEGKPSLSANLLATCVKRHPKYDYRVVQIDDTAAELTFLADGEVLGQSRFTIEQAKRAGLVRNGSGWMKFPEAMLFARALSQGVRWHCPDVTAGSPAYTPEELGADVDEHGEVIAVEVEQEPAEEPAGPRIDEERAEQILKGIDVLGVRFVDVDLTLGAAGLDSLRAHSKKALEERIRELSPEQADDLEAELEVEADRQGDV